MRNKFLLAAAALALSMGAANAADMPIKARPLPPAPVWSWEGAYVGINGGYSWSRWDTTCTARSGSFCLLTSSGGGTATTAGGVGAALNAFNSLFTDKTSPNVDGGVIGGHIGRNWQNGHWVWGLEADLDWSSERASLSNAGTLDTPAGNNRGQLTETDTNDWRLKWFGSGRVRVGFAQDTWLFYLTGGFAVGGMSYSTTKVQSFMTTTPGGVVVASAIDFSAAPSDSTTRFGGALGGGIEKAFTNNLVGRVEYLYLDFGSRTFISGDRLFETNIRLHDNIVRAALSWKFDCCAVVARY